MEGILKKRNRGIRDGLRVWLKTMRQIRWLVDFQISSDLLKSKWLFGQL